MARKTWTWRRPIIKWTINSMRKDKRTGVQQPVKSSRYFKHLSEIGAGWKNNVG